MPRIHVKWGAKKLDVDVSTELEPLVLKSQLFEMTGVLPERQKVIVKVGYNPLSLPIVYPYPIPFNSSNYRVNNSPTTPGEI